MPIATRPKGGSLSFKRDNLDNMYKLILTLFALVLALTFTQSASADVQAHAMIYTCCTPQPQVAVTLDQAARSGAKYVRLDVELHGIATAPGEFDFTKIDQIQHLARERGLRILAVLHGMPWWLRACTSDINFNAQPTCATRDPSAYAAVAAKVVRHAKYIRAWEFWNEPDLDYAFRGTPEEYGHMLLAFHRAVPANVRVAMGGMAAFHKRSRFLAEMFDAVPASRRAFEIANMHLRGNAADMRSQAQAVKRFYARSTGRRVPLWITEHGYPSDTNMQHDPRFIGGEVAQARYLRTSIAGLQRGGANQVFVTLRDNQEFGTDSPYRSEGIVNLDTDHVKRAFATVRTMNK
jgi:hypothetical protein